MNDNQWDYDYSALYRSAQQSQASDTMAQSTAYPQPPVAPKKGKAKRIISFALALVLFAGVGVGGGYLGGTLATSGKNSGTVINQVAAGGVGALSSSDGGMSISQVVEIAAPSVVEVTTEHVTTNAFVGQFVTDGAGSGVILTADGYIITNDHVVSGAQQIKVMTSDKKEYTATLVGSDSKTDIAVLKIEATGLPAATVGDSASLAVGDFALAVGNPLGTLGGTVTDGIISALDREITVENQSMTLLQTNAAVSPGNSGGGLFNNRGELIGIVNAKSSASNTEGLGFAVPASTAVKVATELIDNGYVTGRPALGINVLTIDDAQTAAQYGVTKAGVYIMTVNSGSSAEKAGLKAGDLIMSVNGTVVNVSADVTGVLDACAVGDTVEMQIIRDDKIVSASIKLEERAPDAEESANNAVDDFAKQFGLG